MTDTEKNKFNKYRQKVAFKSPWHLEEQVMSIQLYVGRLTCGYVVPLIFDRHNLEETEEGVDTNLERERVLNGLGTVS